MNFRYLGVLLILSILTISAMAGSILPASEQYHKPRMKAGTTSAYNWAGYAVTGSPKSVSDVKSSWIVPAIVGTCPSTNQYSSFWVGIDGFSSNTVEQIGTDSDCQNGNPVYYAWYEFYPQPMFIFNTMTVHSGDKMAAEVKYTGNNRFTVTMTDTTTGQTVSKSAKVSSAQRSSAEWIAEAPYSGGILPLANFGVADFGLDYTGIGQTNYATVGTNTGAIGSFGPAVQQITMVSYPTGSATKAYPSALTYDGTSFTTTWLNAGP